MPYECSFKFKCSCHFVKTKNKNVSNLKLEQIAQKKYFVNCFRIFGASMNKLCIFEI